MTVSTYSMSGTAEPIDVLFQVAKSLRSPVLLDSTLHGEDAWTILTAEPSREIDDELPPWRPGPSSTASTLSAERDPRPPLPEDMPPFRTGWIGFLSYESGPALNPDLTTRPRDACVPRMHWSQYRASIAYRHSDRTWWASWVNDESAMLQGLELRRCLANAASSGRASLSRAYDVGSPEPEVSLDSYVRKVEAIQEWIARGHIYQANLTYQMRAAFEGRGLDLYPELRRTSPVPFGAYLRIDHPAPDHPEGATDAPLEILAASPELYLSTRGTTIRTRPIKGTRPRALSNPERDAALARELFLSEKDRAELTMIVDLERNDLGRVCEYGSVRTHAFPRVESYRGVHHLVADVEGKLRPSVSLKEILAATFPGGSVTGAPKIRAMELIAELESSPRGIYTGALGYLDDSGDMTLSLTIRTLSITPGRERELRFGVGGGIVADSVPAHEWAETEHKAKTLVEALRSRDEAAASDSA